MRRISLLSAVVLLASSCDAPGVLAPGDGRFAVSPEISQPTNVQVERTENGRVLISFEHDGVGLHRLILSRSTSATGPWVEVHGTNKSHARLFSDGGYPVTAAAVWWRVTACTQSGACSDSEPVSRSDLRLISVPGSLGHRLVLESTGDSVTIQWSNVENHATWGSVERLRSFELVVLRVSTGGDSATLVRELPRMLDPILFTDSTVEHGKIYTYRAQVRNLVGAGPLSPPLDISTGSPARPSHTDAVLTRWGRVRVTVGHDGVGLDEWRVHARVPGGPWRMVWRRSNQGQRSFDLPYDPDHDVWEWRVLACRHTTTYELDPDDPTKLVACAASEVIRLEGLELHPPTNLHLVENEPHAIRLAWTDGSGLIRGTSVQRRLLTSAQVTELARVPYGTATYTDTTADPWQGYEYRVQSYNDVGTTDATQWLRVGPSQTEFPPPHAITDTVRILDRGIRVYGRGLGSPVPDMESYGWLQWSTSPDFAGAREEGKRLLNGDSLVVLSNAVFTPAAAGTYYYRAAAANEVADTVFGETRVFVYQAPPAPTGLSGRVEGGAVVIDYAHPGTHVSHWRLFRRTIGAATWILVRSDSSPTARSLVDSSVSGNVSGYEWRVDACTYQLCTPSAAFRFGS